MKKMIAIALAALMVVALFAGCGAKAEAPAASAASGAIKLGMSGPLPQRRLEPGESGRPGDPADHGGKVGRILPRVGYFRHFPGGK